jgi:hypothetical protein
MLYKGVHKSGTHDAGVTMESLEHCAYKMLNHWSMLASPRLVDIGPLTIHRKTHGGDTASILATISLLQCAQVENMKARMLVNAGFLP